MLTEIWKDVPSVPGLMASSWGRVKVLPYEQKMPHGGVRIRSVSPTYGVWVSDQNRFLLVFRRKSYKIHQLVCEAFNGPKPFDRAVVMHDDENPRNNVPKNLIWGTQKQNLNYPGFLEKNREHNRRRVAARKLLAGPGKTRAGLGECGGR